jgi:hypothetical protein
MPYSLNAGARWVADQSLLFTDDQSPFRAWVAKGHPKLLVIVGENASGKSLFFRILCGKAREQKVTPVSISIRERTGAGSSDMSGLRRVMMFGDEIDQSTGAASIQVVQSGFRNLNHPQGSILALDEPELGLSDGYAKVFGQYIGQQTRKTPKVCAGVVVVTHSRSLVSGLVQGLGAEPSFVVCGPHPRSLQDWLATPEIQTIESLLALPDVGLERFRQVITLTKDK